MTILYKSKTGEIGTKAFWEYELDRFWQCFNAKGICRKELPNRPHDAWDRFARILGLEEIQNEHRA